MHFLSSVLSVRNPVWIQSPRDFRKLSDQLGFLRMAPTSWIYDSWKPLVLVLQASWHLKKGYQSCIIYNSFKIWLFFLLAAGKKWNDCHVLTSEKWTLYLLFWLHCSKFILNLLYTIFYYFPPIFNYGRKSIHSMGAFFLPADWKCSIVWRFWIWTFFKH